MCISRPALMADGLWVGREGQRLSTGWAAEVNFVSILEKP